MYAWGRRNEWMGWRGEGVGERIVGSGGKAVGDRWKNDDVNDEVKKGRND